MKSNLVKGIFRVLSAILLLIVILMAMLVAYLTVDEYKPEDIEELEIAGRASELISLNTDYKAVSWNIGYGALGDNADFFLDGGKMVNTATRDRVIYNLDGIISEVESVDPDFLLIQEADRSSTRSHFVNEITYLAEESASAVFNGMHSFANNFKVAFLPYPIPPIGKVDAGIATYSRFKATSSKRIKLPSPFTWPLSTANLKRCLNVTSCPIQGSDKELVLINLHLEAYDDGAGKEAQTKMLREYILGEIEKGNYVIAGGDFNQVFSNVDTSMYPNIGVDWVPSVINIEDFGENISFYTGEGVPTCRSLDKVLSEAEKKDPQSFQYFVLDGFLVSSNVKVKEVVTEDLGFECSDHNPVILSFELAESN